MKLAGIFLFLFLFDGVSNQLKKPFVEPVPTETWCFDELNLNTGDLVLRKGKGLISNLFSQASLRNKDYSHAGLLVTEGDQKYVYHMIGQRGIHSGFKKELLTEFINKKENTGYAIYRYRFMADHQEAIKLHLRKLQQLNLAFDEQFQLESDTALYCTEMIYKTLQMVCNKQLETTQVKNMKYIAVDNLYMNPHTLKITSSTY